MTSIHEVPVDFTSFVRRDFGDVKVTIIHRESEIIQGSNSFFDNVIGHVFNLNLLACNFSVVVYHIDLIMLQR